MSEVHPCRVAGREVRTEELLGVQDPATGEEIARVCLAGPPEAERALQAAVEAFREMRASSRYCRHEWLMAIVRGLEERRDEFAATLVQEAGKPLQFARGEVARAISTFTMAAEEALRFGGEQVPLDVTAAGEGYRGSFERFALGPVLAISPFNFPLNLVAHKVAPALAVGCPILVKPAPDTPLTALLLGEVVEACGAPPGAISVLPMDNGVAEQYLVRDPRPRLLTFTGSAAVGWHLKSVAGDKRVVLELGGNAPALVHADANLGLAVAKLVSSGYAYAGQVCISAQRILVHRSVLEKFRDRFVAAVEALAVGDPKDARTVVGPLIRERDVARVADWVDRAVAQGARVLCGGRAEGRFYQPTVLEDVQPDMWVCQREVFGPVTVLIPYDTVEEALALANQGDYGLQAALFTNDLWLVDHAFRTLEFGGVIVNESPSFRVDHMPYGGVKRSGLGREGLRYAMEDMSEIRMLVVNRNVPH